MFIHLRSVQNLAATPQLLYSVAFKDKRAVAALVSSVVFDQHFHHTLSTRVPPIEAMEGPECFFLWMIIADEYGNQIAQMPIGEFFCETASPESIAVHQQMSRTGKESLQAGSGIPGSSRRSSAQQICAEAHGQSFEERVQPPLALQPQRSPNPALGIVDPSGRRYAPQGRTPSFASGQVERSDRPIVKGRVKREEVDERRPSSHIPLAISPGFRETTESQSMAHASARSRQAVTVGMANPPLIRTSILQPSPGPSISSPDPSQQFNPYSIYPNNKAVLKIEGDLDGMLEDWSEEELRVKRRLVEFKRSQSGNTITTSFKPVTLEQRAPNSICVSCIWWEGRGESFITSVDTIYLLESLVAVRFTVEEKNRIRRNLEGFRPLTVAKGKLESDEFFRTIMGFPNPKPRNIEKDVKVFPWKILNQALKKIIGKYVSDKCRLTVVRH